MNIDKPSKLFILLVICCKALVPAFSQIVPVIEWQRCYGGSLSEASSDMPVQQTPDGGFIGVCSTTSNNGDVSGNHGSSDFWVVKMNASGSIIWQKCYGGTGSESFSSFQQTTDGGYILAGVSGSNDGDVSGNHGLADFWVIKLNDLGNIMWQKSFGGSGDDRCFDIQQTTDGGYIACGTSQSNDGDVTGNHGEHDFWVIRLDGSGTLLWQKTLGGSLNDAATFVRQTADGFIVAGNTQSSDGDVTGYQGNGDGWVVKLDEVGNMVWQKTFGKPTTDRIYGGLVHTDGGIVVTGHTRAIGNTSSNAWLMKIDESGNLVWENNFGGSESDDGEGIEQTSDGGYIFIGRSSSSDGDVTVNHGLYDYWLVKTSSAGILEWQKSLGGINQDFGYNVQQTADGGFILGGLTQSHAIGDVGPNHGQADFWIVKLSAAGPIPVTLGRFEAILSGKDVLCRWNTLQEQNSSHFVIERSEDGINFSKVGRVAAAGNSATALNYNFTDENALTNGKAYLFYRLRMVDSDGSFSVSNTVRVKLNNETGLQVYPNPAGNLLSVSFVHDVKEKGVIRIVDETGRTLFQQEININQGKNIIPLNIASLPNGTYNLLLNGHVQQAARFIKMEE